MPNPEQMQTHFDYHAREEIARAVWDKFMFCASRAAISIYPYAIQITIMPPKGEEFSVPDALNAVHMTVEDDHKIEEHRV